MPTANGTACVASGPTAPIVAWIAFVKGRDEAIRLWRFLKGQAGPRPSGCAIDVRPSEDGGDNYSVVASLATDDFTLARLRDAAVGFLAGRSEDPRSDAADLPPGLRDEPTHTDDRGIASRLRGVIDDLDELRHRSGLAGKDHVVGRLGRDIDALRRIVEELG